MVRLSRIIGTEFLSAKRARKNPLTQGKRVNETGVYFLVGLLSKGQFQKQLLSIREPIPRGPEHSLILAKSLRTLPDKSMFHGMQQAGLLAHRSSHQPPSQFPSGISAALPKYSDGIVQDSHLFPS